GSCLRGRMVGNKDVCYIIYKVLIDIEPVSGMYFFPTESPLNKSCSWLAHSYIADINPINDGSKIVIKFTNGIIVTIDISYGSMQNQLNRTELFRYRLNERMKLDQYTNIP